MFCASDTVCRTIDEAALDGEEPQLSESEQRLRLLFAQSEARLLEGIDRRLAGLQDQLLLQLGGRRSPAQQTLSPSFQARPSPMLLAPSEVPSSPGLTPSKMEMFAMRSEIRTTSLFEDEDDPMNESQSISELERAQRTMKKHQTVMAYGEIVKPIPLAKRVMSHPSFNIILGVAIVTSSMMTGLQTDLEARGQLTSNVWEGISAFYTLLFTVEIVLRVCVERSAFFWTSPNVTWNYLDSFIVLSSLVDMIATVILAVSGGRSAVTTTQLRIFYVLRITRLLRIVRLTRLIKFLRALRMMVHQLMSTMKSLIWAVLLLVLIIFVYAVLFTRFWIFHNEQRTTRGALDDALDMYWSTLPRSMLTLVQTITGGISWDVASRPLSEIHGVLVMAFVVYVCFTQMAVLNVIVGFFCQNAIESAAHDQELVAQTMLENKLLYEDKLSQIFRAIDTDGSGTVTIEEFKKHLNDEMVRAYFDSMELDTSDVKTLFRLLDTDSENGIEMEEFLTGCLRLKGNAKGLDVAMLRMGQDKLWQRLEQFIIRTDAAFDVIFGPQGRPYGRKSTGRNFSKSRAGSKATNMNALASMSAQASVESPSRRRANFVDLPSEAPTIVSGAETFERGISKGSDHAFERAVSPGREMSKNSLHSFGAAASLPLGDPQAAHGEPDVTTGSSATVEI